MTIATRFPKSWAVPKFDIKDPSLVLYLPLWYPYSDMAGGTIYSYDTNRHVGTVTSTVWGRLGRYLDGAANQIITIPSHTALDITGSITLWAWINPDAWNVEYPKIMVKPSGNGWADPYSYWGLQAGGTVAQGYVPTFWINNAASNGITSSETLTAGIWYFIMGVYDLANMYLYINMVQRATSAYTTAISTSTEALAIGNRSNTSNGEIYKGYLGDCGIYNRALSVAEGTRLMQATKWRYS